LLHAEEGIAEDLLAVLTQIVNHMLQGDVAKEGDEYVKGSQVHAVRKGRGFRALCCGCYMRRLTGKCLCGHVKPELEELLSREGQALMSPSGVHSVRMAYSTLFEGAPDELDDEDPVETLFLDLRNAYNLADRRVMLKAVHEFCPKAFRWTNYLYGSEDPILFWHNTEFVSSNGTEQGDPIGGMMFALALIYLIRAIKEAAPDLWAQLWFADDGMLMGRRSDLIKAFRVILEKGPWLGFFAGLAKTLRFAPRDEWDQPLAEEDVEALGPFLSV
jgi:hypothetical protein